MIPLSEDLMDFSKLSWGNITREISGKWERFLVLCDHKRLSIDPWRIMICVERYVSFSDTARVDG